MIITLDVSNINSDDIVSQEIVSSSEMLRNVCIQLDILIISSNCCNDLNELNLNIYMNLRLIQIGDNCFGSVKTFKIEELKCLTNLKIGKNSFTHLSNSDKWSSENSNDSSKSFHILNCESLELIEIGECSFSDFGGEFELKNLPQLQSIQIGSIENDSYNFYHCSFVIQGIELILNI